MHQGRCGRDEGWGGRALAILVLLGTIIAAGAQGRPADLGPLAPAEAGAQAASLRPFLDIVPAEDGRSVFVGAGAAGLDQPVASLVIGPTGNKGSYTMTFSDTLRSFVALVPGFAPGVSVTSTVVISTGAQLSQPVEFYRAYVPGGGPDMVASPDGGLELSVVSADTFAAPAYVVVTPGLAPPGPPPPGRRIVGRSYSVRASGARVTSERPMLLRMRFSPGALSAEERAGLAIYRWGGQGWERLDSTAFAGQGYVSAAADRFTSYALMAPADALYLPLLSR